MRLRILLILSLGLGLYALVAQATVVNNLYSAKVIVPDQSTQAWDQALPQALNQVLIKLSGNSEVVKSAAVKQAAAKAKAWVKSYSYHEQWQQDESQLWLRYDFDSNPINQLLQQANQAKWSNDRPLTLVWLELDEGQAKPKLVDAQNPFEKLIEQNAERRGIPILLPTADLEDQQHLAQSLTNPANWEWTFAHYEVKAVLVGQLKSVNNQWQAQWLLVSGSDSKQWQDKAESMNTLIASSMNESANWMASQQLVGNDPNAKIQKLTLQVADVQDLGDYAKISDYLTQLSFIKHVSLGGVNSTGMVFELKVAGTQEQLVKALSSSSDLVPDETAHPEAKNTLYYRWAQSYVAASDSSTSAEMEVVK